MHRTGEISSAILVLLLSTLSLSHGFKQYHDLEMNAPLFVSASPNVNATFTRITATIAVPPMVSDLDGQTILYQMQTIDDSDTTNLVVALVILADGQYYMEANLVYEGTIFGLGNVPVYKNESVSAFITKNETGHWTVGFEMNRITYKTETPAGLRVLPQTRALFFMQAANIQSCDQYPSSNEMSFSELNFQTEGGHIGTNTEWTTFITVDPMCGEGVKASSELVQFFWNSKL